MERITPATIHQKLQHRNPKPLEQRYHSSVMVLLFQMDGQLHFIFTKRADTLKRQPGDICFPGGRQEGEETPLETALRETEEELGISREHIDILGQSDYMITASGTIIFPFLGYITGIGLEDLRYNTDEVSEIFTVPLQFFQNTLPEIHYLSFQADFSEDFPFDKIVNGKNYPFSTPKIPEYFYDYNGLVIWGITARITEHIVSLILQ